MCTLYIFKVDNTPAFQKKYHTIEEARDAGNFYIKNVRAYSHYELEEE